MMSPGKMKIPLTVDVKRNSLDDGPGIRSVVFFKGCPLACVWCQNPECISAKPEIQPLPEQCLACFECAEACPGDLVPGGPSLRASDCRVCGACVEACPAGARRIAGRRLDLDQLARQLARDAPFYKRSGGGVTLSGGEPFMYPEFVGRLAARLADKGIHVLAETSGWFDFDRVAEHLLPNLSAVYFDLKIADGAEHKRRTGRDNARIEKNFRRLAELGFEELLPRVPLIPGVTDDRENLQALAGFLVGLGVHRAALLPYNPLWLGKRRALGMDLEYDHPDWMPDDRIEACRQVFEREGLTLED